MLSRSLPAPLSAPGPPVAAQPEPGAMARSLIITGKMLAAIIRNAASGIEELVAAAWKECPNCKYHIYNSDASSQWPGLPDGVKFDPTDQELLGHLEGKVGRAASHALIDEFIPTIKEVEGICYTHPENLPGIKMDGSSNHFFHRISNAYDVGGRKRRKISNKNHIDSDEPMRWHKTGRSSRIFDNGVLKGWKKILVLYKCEKGKRQRTNWTMHECHLGVEEGEEHGELVVSRVFWQVRSNNTGKSEMHAADEESGSFAVKMDPTTPNTYPPQPRRLSGSPFETEQNQDEEESGSSGVQPAWVAGTSQAVDYSLPGLDEHTPCNDNILDARHEKPPSPEYPGIDELDGFSDLDFTFLATQPDFLAQTGIASATGWTENVA
ncbi:unnamed protein product [Alopecurus aequalis]